MRKILLSLLLATTVATPALAQRTDREDRAAARQERKAERSEARQERSQQAPAEHTQAPKEHSQAPADRSQARQDRVEVRQDRVDARQQRVEARPEQMQGNYAPVRQGVRERAVRDNRPAIEQRQDARGNANWRRDQRDVTQQQIEQRAERNRVRVPVGARPDRPAPPPETAYNGNRHPEWRTDWRRDHRYDWRNYRHQHRSTFHLGIYFDPFGWGYQRYGIGWRLWPSYYSSNYWLNDPYMYRLPYAPFPYKWVRYYDDALLVNVYTGQVVDVMYDFFW